MSVTKCTRSYPERRYPQEGPGSKRKVYGTLLFVAAKAVASSFDISNSTLMLGGCTKYLFLDRSSITPTTLASAVIVWEAIYQEIPMSELPKTSGRWFRGQGGLPQPLALDWEPSLG